VVIVRIVVDGMGGDNCPNAIVEGCILAQKEYDIEIFITGPKELISKELKKYNVNTNKITIVDAREVISAEEHPAMAVRRKKNSSLSKALYMVKNGEANAVISAGSTGAFLTGATLIVGRIKGINRPALAPVMPGKNAPFMVIDCGANAECKPKNLIQFALMGDIYFKKIMGVDNPTIGLVNIGIEEGKGNELTKETYNMLKQMKFNFVGNVEAREISTGNVNVLVCDGFVGNTILKMYEGVSMNLFSIIKNEMLYSFRGKIGGFMLKPVFKKIAKDFDYKEYGGATFLGVDGICIKAHGSSDAKAIKNAIAQSIKYYNNNIIENIKSELEEVNSFC